MRIAEHAIAQVVRGLDPEDVVLGDVTEVWSSFDRIERLAACAKTLLAARVDEAGEWKRAGARSAADHPARSGGTDAIAGAAAVDPAAELRLVRKAQSTNVGELRGGVFADEGGRGSGF